MNNPVPSRAAVDIAIPLKAPFHSNLGLHQNSRIQGIYSPSSDIQTITWVALPNAIQGILVGKASKFCSI